MKGELAWREYPQAHETRLRKIAEESSGVDAVSGHSAFVTPDYCLADAEVVSYDAHALMPKRPRVEGADTSLAHLFRRTF
jgi:hypothetical protein